MERRHLQEKEKMRKEAAAKIRETKTAMAQLAGVSGSRGQVEGAEAWWSAHSATCAGTGCCNLLSL